MTRLSYTPEVLHADKDEAEVAVHVSEIDEADGLVARSLELTFTYKAETTGPQWDWDFEAEWHSTGECRCTKHNDDGTDSSVDVGAVADLVSRAKADAIEAGADAAWEAIHNRRRAYAESQGEP